jgi:hypothetical protein
MKIAIIIVLLCFASCSSLPVSEPASLAYSESLQEKAKSLRSKPNATEDEKSAANDLERAAKLIKTTGKQSANDQKEIQDLSRDSGWKDGLVWVFWVAVSIFVAAMLFNILKRRMV